MADIGTFIFLIWAAKALIFAVWQGARRTPTRKPREAAITYNTTFKRVQDQGKG
jgi:hypothetical protein